MLGGLWTGQMAQEKAEFKAMFPQFWELGVEA